MTMFKCESCGHEQLPARQEQGDEVRRLREALEKAQEFVRKSAEHDSMCDVFDLDDDDRHKPCSCGLDEVIQDMHAVLSTQQMEGKA